MKKLIFIFGGLVAFSLCAWTFVGLYSNHFEVPEAGITFHEVPLVCNAAPDIGCGSRSKPILLALENEPTIQEAWLNRTGTVTAIVWQKNTIPNVKAVPAIFKNHDKSFITLSGDTYKEQLASFYQKDNSEKADKWYRGDEVDELSMEEAGRIASKILDPLVVDKILSEEDAPAFHSEVEAYIQNQFLTLKDVSLLSTTEYYDQWEKAIHKMSEKYVDKDKMPEIELCGPSSTSCKSSRSCCAKDKKSCGTKLIKSEF